MKQQVSRLDSDGLSSTSSDYFLNPQDDSLPQQGGEPTPPEWLRQQKEALRARRVPPTAKQLQAAAEQVVASANALRADPVALEARRVQQETELRAALQAGGSPTNGVGVSPGGREDAVVIFDWDDTLFPTWFLSEVAMPSAQFDMRKDALPDDSPHRERLAAHGRAVRAALVAARSVAQVAIVTLALRPWVVASAERYLEGFNAIEVLRELEIPVLYAREHVKRPDACLAKVEEGVDVFTVAKRRAMLKALRKLSSRSKSTSLNVISVGDSLTEKDAIMEVLWSASEQHHQANQATSAPLCKTVKFIDNPSVDMLTDQLQLFEAWVPRMAAFNEDIDLVMDDAEDVSAWAKACGEQ